MADYFAHWLEIGRREGAKLPKLFNVNWFRKDLESGEYLWPGFGENSRVLEWVFERCDGARRGASRRRSACCRREDALDLDGRRRQRRSGCDEVLKVDLDEWREEIPLDPRVLRRVRRQAAGGAARARWTGWRAGSR